MSLSKPSFLRTSSALAALATVGLAALTSQSAHAIDIDAGDYTALPEGTNVVALYGQHAQRKCPSAGIARAAARVGARWRIGRSIAASYRAPGEGRHAALSVRLARQKHAPIAPPGACHAEEGRPCHRSQFGHRQGCVGRAGAGGSVGRNLSRHAIAGGFAARDARLRTLKILNDVEENLSGYLIVVSAINLALGAVATVMAWTLGLPEDRARTIVGGSCAVVAIMRYFGLESIRISERDLLDGIVAELRALGFPVFAAGANPMGIQHGIHKAVGAAVEDSLTASGDSRGREYGIVEDYAGHGIGNARPQILPHALEWLWKGYPISKIP